MKKLLLGLAVATAALNAPAQLPHDPAIRTGRLANGLTYYIR